MLNSNIYLINVSLREYIECLYDSRFITLRQLEFRSKWTKTNKIITGDSSVIIKLQNKGYEDVHYLKRPYSA